MVEAGAAIIDIGGESTRPGAQTIGEQEELDRVVPIIESIRTVTNVPISVDTSKPAVMREAVAAGASHDQRRTRAAGGRRAAGRGGAAGAGLPDAYARPAAARCRSDPQYDDVVAEVAAFLGERVEACVAAGLDENLIVVDPGFGFGKTHRHNVELLANLRQLRVRNRPAAVGMSRKSTLGAIDRTVTSTSVCRPVSQPLSSR